MIDDGCTGEDAVTTRFWDKSHATAISTLLEPGNSRDRQIVSRFRQRFAAIRASESGGDSSQRR